VLLSMGLIQEGADGGGTAPAFRATAEVTVDLSRGAGAIRAWIEAATHLPVGEDIARAEDQGSPRSLEEV
jgi:hypothetical protein